MWTGKFLWLIGKWKLKVLLVHSCLTPCNPMHVACQLPPPMEFSSQEYWSGLTFPPPGDLPDAEIEPVSPELASEFFTAEPWGKHTVYIWRKKIVDSKWMYIEFYFILSNCSTKRLHKFISRQQCLLYSLLTDGVVKFLKTYQCNECEMASHYSFIRYLSGYCWGWASFQTLIDCLCFLLSKLPV